MNEKELFEKGCFLPCWAEESDEQILPEPPIYTRQNKDLQTLLDELAEINNHIEDVQARLWSLDKKIYYQQNNF